MQGTRYGPKSCTVKAMALRTGYGVMCEAHDSGESRSAGLRGGGGWGEGGRAAVTRHRDLTREEGPGPASRPPTALAGLGPLWPPPHTPSAQPVPPPRHAAPFCTWETAA